MKKEYEKAVKKPYDTRKENKKRRALKENVYEDEKRDRTQKLPR